MTTQPELPFTPEQKEAVFGSAWGLEETAASLGVQLRDAALAQSKQGREERIKQVREELLRGRDADRRANCWVTSLTGDDVLAAAERLGLLDGDSRWTGNVLRGWAAVAATDRYEKSRREECHARPKRVWVFR